MQVLKRSLITSYVIIDFLVRQLLHKYQNIEDETGDESVEGKIVVVTGANGGIGLAVTTELVRRKAIVIMACRDEEKTQRAIQSIKQLHPEVKGQMIPVQLDLSNLNSVRRCAREINERFPRINILINNAGIMWARNKLERSADGFESHLATNHLGHFLFTLLLVKQLKKGAPSRIVTVSSSGAQSGYIDLDDLNWERKDPHLGVMNLQPYLNSKLANFYFSRELGKRLEGTGINSYGVCPGLVKSDLSKTWTGIAGIFSTTYLMLAGTATKNGSETILYCALSKDVGKDTGKAYRFRHNWKTMDNQLQEDTALGLWEKSEKMTGVTWDQVV